MRKIVCILFSGIISCAVFGQGITGRWNGILKVQGIQLWVVFNISATDTGYVSTMDSPDQGAKGIPVTLTRYENATLKLAVLNAGIEYEGVLGTDGNVAGQFKQGGQVFPLNLSKATIEKDKLVRPQEPVKPYPYYTEEVNFYNIKAGVSLAGTLSLPNQNEMFAVVVLISGSGPQNRDEELLGHKPFLVMADYLTKNGIAVLRFDDRGTGASTGDFKIATTSDFSTDVEAAVTYLQTRKEINKKKIGLMGHSEGGIIAPMVAARVKDIAFIVLLAGPGLPGDQLLLLQQASIAKASGASDAVIQKAQEMNKGAFDKVTKSVNPQQLKTDLTAYIKQISKNDPDKPAGMSEEDYVNFQVGKVSNPWMTYFLKYDPAIMLEKVRCPVLAINGEKDRQVPPEENLAAIEKALLKGGNKNVTTKALPGLNHLFQECKTGLPNEYAAIEQTFSPGALALILTWIQTQTK